MQNKKAHLKLSRIKFNFIDISKSDLWKKPIHYDRNVPPMILLATFVSSYFRSIDLGVCDQDAKRLLEVFPVRPMKMESLECMGTTYGQAKSRVHMKREN